MDKLYSYLLINRSNSSWNYTYLENILQLRLLLFLTLALYQGDLTQITLFY
jgi:hypothetical protein